MPKKKQKLEPYQEYARQILEAKSVQDAENLMLDIINCAKAGSYWHGVWAGYDVGFDDGYKKCERDMDW